MAVADHRGRRDGEVDRSEQRVVELGLGDREADRRRRGQPDHVHALGQLAEHGADDVAPQRREVVALVEQHDADAELGQRLHALAGRLGEQVAQLDAGVLAARDLALERRADLRQLARPALGGGALERLALALDLLAGHAGGGGALVGPARLRQPSEHDLRILELAQRLVGEARDRLERVGAGHVRGRAREVRDRARPLLLDALVRGEHERALADAPDQLDAEQRLARAGRRDDVRALAAVLAVLLERGQRGALVRAPVAVERQRFEVPAHRRARSCARRSEVR